MPDTAARLALVARRYEVCRFSIAVTGIDLTGVAMNMQVRMQRGTPGAPLIQLGTVATTAAEGLKLDSVTVTDGVSTSIIKGRINQSTMSTAASVPFAGELGADVTLAYAMQWTLVGDAQTRLEGDFIVRDCAYGSDNAPANRPVSYGGSGGRLVGVSTGSLTFGDQVVQVSLADTDLLAPIVALAGAARDGAAAAQAGAEVALTGAGSAANTATLALASIADAFAPGEVQPIPGLSLRKADDGLWSPDAPFFDDGKWDPSNRSGIAVDRTDLSAGQPLGEGEVLHRRSIGAQQFGTAEGITKTNLSTSHAGQQDLSVAPYGNPLATVASTQLITNSNPENAGAREFVSVLGAVFQHGQGATDPANPNDKVVSYIGVVAYTGTADFWIANWLSAYITTDAVNHQGLELDLNMVTPGMRFGAGRTGGASLAGGLMPDGSQIPDTKAVKGIAITGVSVAGGTANTAFLSAGVNPLFQHGFATGAYGGIQSGFMDASLATVAFRVAGANIDGVNTADAALSTSAVHIGNNQRITGLNAAKNGRLAIAKIDGFDNLLIGTDGDGPIGSPGNIIAGAPLLPLTDNAFSLGGASNRWSSIWSANSTIATSDIVAKTDIEHIDPDMAMALVRGIAPISYRFRVGGMEPVTKIVRQLAPVTRTVEVADDVVTRNDDGSVTITRGTKTVHEDVMDEVPVLGPDGEQLTVEHRDAETGEVTAIPLTRHVQRMAEQDVPVTTMQPRPGVRVHAGFDAGEVKDAFEAQGVDYGAYVKDATDGLRGLRHGEMLALLWAANRALDARLTALEAR